MILSENDALEYAQHHAITKEDISMIAVWLPNQIALESCLGLIDCGYKVKDIEAMRDSFHDRKLSQFPWHLLDEKDPYYLPEQDTE